GTGFWVVWAIAIAAIILAISRERIEKQRTFEAFVQRCVTSFNRKQRRLLLVKAAAACAAAAVIGVFVPPLYDWAAAASSHFGTTLAELDRSWNLSTSLSTVSAAFARVLDGIDRPIAIGIVLVLVTMHYGPRLFRGAHGI